MNRIFDITTASEPVSIGEDGRGEIAFTVANSSDSLLRGQLRVTPLGSTKGEWLNIAGETERAFSPNATQQVIVKIATPPGAPAGKYQFRLDAISVINPDNDFTEGPTIDFEVKATAASKNPFPWRLIAAAAALILIVAVTWWFWPKGATPKVDTTVVVFEDNFDDTPKGAWSQTKTETAPNGKTKFLGQFGTDSVKLTLNDLPPHKTVTVSFDLYINNVWGGDDEELGPDAWGLKLDDTETLIHTTFSNLGGCPNPRDCGIGRQAYACKNGEDTANGCYARGEDAAFGADAINSLGYNAIPTLVRKDSAYKIKRTFAHDKSLLLLSFFCNLKGNPNSPGPANITGWGVDNVRIEAHSKELTEVLPNDGTKVVFEDNFEEAPKGAWSQTKTETAPNGKTKFLGQFGTDTVKLTLNDLPPHKTVTVNFDLYINNTWEGAHSRDGVGPDIWALYQGEENPFNQFGRGPNRQARREAIFGPNALMLILTSFSNMEDRDQNFACENGAYTAPFCSSSTPGRATFGAAALNSLGFKNSTCVDCRDSVYKIKRVFTHDKSQLILTFFSELKEQLEQNKNTSNEGWGLDNVRIEVQ